MMRFLLFSFFAVLVTGCTSVPDGIQPVSPFDVNRYLGKWYEIARLDHKFERGLSQVSAEYSLGDSGEIQVINRGFSAEHQRWEQAEGKAYFVSDSKTGHLKVSFFGPFYGAYVIFGLDKPYHHAYISGPNREYLWFLSRTPEVDQQQLSHFVQAAKKAGFDTEALIYVDQSAE